VQTVTRPPDGDERLAEITQGHFTCLPDLLFSHHDPHPLAVLQPAEGMDPLVVAADAQLRLLAHLDLGDQIAGRRVPSGELDTGRLTEQAASAVAPETCPCERNRSAIPR
jgi:hypothetical protein